MPKRNNQDEVVFFGSYDGWSAPRRERKPPPGAHKTGWPTADGSDEYCFLDEDGHWTHMPRRTKYSHPYSYDPITHYRSDEKGTDACYSDRLSQWDYKKYDACVKKHFKGGGGFASKKETEAFMRDYMDAPKLQVTKLVEVCNASSGYAVFVIHYIKEPA